MYDDLAALGADLQARLESGALDGLGPVMLTHGPFASATLAGRVVLADLDHLTTLAEHTGSPPAPERWAVVAADVHLLLLASNPRPDKATNGRDTPPAPAS